MQNFRTLGLIIKKVHNLFNLSDKYGKIIWCALKLKYIFDDKILQLCIKAGAAVLLEVAQWWFRLAESSLSPSQSLPRSLSLSGNFSQCSVREGTLARVKDFSIFHERREERMENNSMQLMAHHSCKIPDDDENIPQGIVTFDYHLWKHDVGRYL